MTTTSSTALARKPYLGLQMEGLIASWYARNTGRDRRRFVDTAQAIADRLPPGSAILEVAPGPGYLSIELARRGFRVTGLDISKSFLRIAADNARRAEQHLELQHGDVARMPFAAESFDFLVCMAAFKNFPDPVAALNEMQRVLRPGGAAWIIDLRKDATGAEIEREVASMRMSAFNAWLTKLIFRFGLLRAAHTRTTVEDFVRRSRFGRGEFTIEGVGYRLELRRDPGSSTEAQ